MSIEINKRQAIAVLIVVILLSVSVFGVLGTNLFKEETKDDKGYTFDMQVISLGDDKLITITSDRPIFGEGITADDFTFKYACLNKYVKTADDRPERFDSDRYYTDLTEKGIVDDESGETIPDGTKEVAPVEFGRNSDTEVACLITEKGTYGFYMFTCDSDNLIDCKHSVSEMILDIPSTMESVPFPYIEINNKVYENEANPTIYLMAYDTVFKSEVSKEMVKFYPEGCLEVKDVHVLYKGTVLKIETLGVVDSNVNDFGVEILEGTTEANTILYASKQLEYNFIYLDFEEFEYNDGVAKVMAYFTSNMLENVQGEKSIKIKGHNETKETKIENPICISDLNVYCGTMTFETDDIKKTLEDMYGAGVYIGDELKTYIFPVEAMFEANVLDHVLTTKGLNLYVELYPLVGTFKEGITRDNIDVGDDAAINKIIIKDGTVLLEVTIPATESAMFNIEVKNGMMGSWGKEVAKSTALVSYYQADEVRVSNSSLPVDDITDNLYKTGDGESGDIFDLVSNGIQLIGGILEMTGVIEIPDPYMIAINNVEFKCDEIKSMLALQSDKLNQISEQLSAIKQQITEIEKRQLATIYKTYVDASNSFNNELSSLGRSVKGEVFTTVIGEASIGETIYLYDAVDSKGDHHLTFTKGTLLFEEANNDTSIDELNIDRSNPLKIEIDQYTFSGSRELGRFIDGKISNTNTTPYHMIDELTRYIDENGIIIDGYASSRDLAMNVYDCIIYKTMEIYCLEHSQQVIDSIKEYKRFVQTLASLNGSGSSDPSIPNPVMALHKLITMKYNFYSEGFNDLKNINQAFILNLYKNSMAIRLIDSLSNSSEPEELKTLYKSGVNYLKDHRDYKDISKHDFCYVTNSFVEGKNVSIKSSGTYHCKNNDWYDHQGTPVTGLSIDAGSVSAVKKYVNEQQMKEIYSRYTALNTGKDFKAYLESKLNIKLNAMIITNYKNLYGNYTQGDGITLKSWDKNILSGQSSYAKRVLKANTWTTMSNYITNSEHYSCEFSRDMFGNFGIRGSMFNCTTGGMASAGADGFIYAVAYVSGHRVSWSYDEAQFYTPAEQIPGGFIDQSKSGKNWTFWYTAVYSMIEIC